MQTWHANLNIAKLSHDYTYTLTAMSQHDCEVHFESLQTTHSHYDGCNTAGEQIL